MRRISFKILYDVFFNKALLNTAIDKYFDDKKISINEDDKAFIRREVAGVIERVDEIDEKINEYSKVKIKKLDNDVLIVLRLGIYEMTFMDKVPNYATVSECVDIIKKSKSNRLSGYVNAVLRNYERTGITKKEINDISKNCYFRIYHDKENIVLEELKTKNVSVNKYDGAFDFNTARVYKALKYKDIIALDSFKKGYILIEDASSIYMTEKLYELLKDKKKVKILDACSAPGGKILGLVDFLENAGIEVEALACDISGEKVSKINENIARLSVSSIKTCISDATIYEKNRDGIYDLVILDVPCTGLGVIDKKPDIKLTYTDEKRDALVAIQKKILDVGKRYVKNGGILSYSTCTETKEENQNNIESFIKENKDFEKIYEKQVLRHDKHDADGFYMCFMKKSII